MSAHVAFVDPAGGSGADSMTLAVAHVELRGAQPVAVVDCIREVRPPFSPETTVAEFASLLARYRVSRVIGDRYAGEWPREQFRKHGIEYEPATRTKSEMYGELLPALNSSTVELLDHPRLLAQLANLERRTARGGRDSIDHAPGGHDDVANSVAGAVVEALSGAAGRCPFCDDPSCGGPDAPPVFILGSPTSLAWERLHLPPSSVVQDAEAVSVAAAEAPPANVGEAALAAGLRAVGDRAATLVQRWHSPGARRRAHEAELAQTPRRREPGLLDVAKAVLVGDEQQARETATAWAARQRDQLEQAAARERYAAAARWLEEQVRRNGGCYMPDRD